MAMELPYTERCRKYGYLYWTKDLDSSVEKFFGGKEQVQVVLSGYLIGVKNVDYKFRRISLGVVTLSRVSEQFDLFRLSFNKEGKLTIEFR
jgi:hypothetical protein